MRRIFSIAFVLALAAAALGTVLTGSAQDEGENVELFGYFNILWPHVDPDFDGDPQVAPEYILDVPDEDEEEIESYSLSGVEQLAEPFGGPHRFNHNHVRIEGTLDSETNRIELDSLDFSIVVESEGLEEPTGSHVFSSHVHGSQQWLNIMCRFNDSVGDPPAEPEYMDDLMDFMDGYWREVSYRTIDPSGGVGIDLDGTETLGWYTLPRDRDDYLSGGSHFEGHTLNFSRLANDCTFQAFQDVTSLLPYDGINLILDDTLDCCAWGGSRVLRTSPGFSTTYKRFSITYMPPWGWRSHAVMGHEMGHGFGLPHSSGPFDTGDRVRDTYDSNWDILSGKGVCNDPHPDFGCVGVHTIAAHKDALGWIPEDRIYVPDNSYDQLVFLERMAGPFQLFGYDMIRLPIEGTTREYYTVESRMAFGFDEEIPGNAVIIHRVDRRLDDRNAQVFVRPGGFTPNDSHAMWRPGDIFEDPELDFTLAVVAEHLDGGGFDVVINPTPADLEVSLSTDPELAVPGDELTYTITVDNHGPFGASNVVVVHTLPEDGTYVSDTGDCDVDEIDGLDLVEVTCNVGDINVNQSTSVDVVIDVPPDQYAQQRFRLESTVEVYEDHETGVDPDVSNNVYTLSTEVINVADVEAVDFSVVDIPPNALVGETLEVEFVLTLRNHGPSIPVNVLLTNTIQEDPGLTVEPLNLPGDQTYFGIREEAREFPQRYDITCHEAGQQHATITNEIEPRFGTDPNPDNNAASENIVIDCVAPVDIDIQGTDGETSINLSGGGVVPVAIFSADGDQQDSSSEFDASTIDLNTVLFGRYENLLGTEEPIGAPVHRGQGLSDHPHGANHPHGRGNAPLIMHFRIQDTELEKDDTRACIIGETVVAGERTTFFGCDDITIRPQRGPR